MDKSNRTDDPVLAPLGYILFPGLVVDLGGGGNSLVERNVHRPSVVGTSSRPDGGGAAGLPGGGGGTGLLPALKEARPAERPFVFGGRAADAIAFVDCELGIPRLGGGGGGGFRTPCGDKEVSGRLRVGEGGVASAVDGMVDGVTVGPRRGGGGGGTPLPGNGGPVLNDARRTDVVSGAEAAADRFACIDVDRDGPPLDNEF